MATFVELDVCRFIANPAAPTVAQQGAAGAATWGYKLVGVDANGGVTAASTEGTEASGNATLTGSNFNRITWTDPTGVTSVKIYRTTSGGTPATLGLIGTVLAGVQTFDDTGLAGDASTAPSANATGYGDATPVAQSKDLTVSITGTFTATLKVQTKVGGADWVESASITAPVTGQIAETCSEIRIYESAYTSGTPVAWLGRRAE